MIAICQKCTEMFEDTEESANAPRPFVARCYSILCRTCRQGYDWIDGCWRPVTQLICLVRRGRGTRP